MSKRRLKRNKLNRRLWHLARRLHLDYEAVHEILQIKSISALGITDLRKCCKILQDELDGRNRGKISEQQIWRIEQLEEQLGWKGAPQRLEGYSNRVTGQYNWKELDIRRASKLIVALNKLLKWNKKNPLPSNKGRSEHSEQGDLREPKLKVHTNRSYPF